MAKFNHREDNIRIFQDTMSTIKKQKILTESVQFSIEHQEFIPDSTPLEQIQLTPKNRLGKVIVTKNSSFNAARNHNGKVAVHNFASATNPGGGVEKGSGAQEECLCRCSTLFPCLSSPEAIKAFYEPHRNGLGVLHNDDIIYTPSVHVIKSDSYTTLYRNSVVDVITCAAPNLRQTPANAYNHESGEGTKISADKLYQLHLKRAKKILAVAASKDVGTIILGAFGCGAFRNDPKVVARAFHDAVKEYRGYFDTIEFAVFCRDQETENYDAFSEAMQDLTQ